MKNSIEEFDVYTIDRQKTGRIMPRGAILPANLYRLIAHVCIFNSSGEMLIQQKADEKSADNIWDFSAGGSALAGENSRQTIRRELKEELGIPYDFSLEKPRMTVYFNGCMDDIYIIRHFDVAINTLKLQTEEVKNVRWASKEKILAMINAGTFIPYDKSYIDLLFFMNRDEEGCCKKLTF